MLEADVRYVEFSSDFIKEMSESLIVDVSCRLLPDSGYDLPNVRPRSGGDALNPESPFVASGRSGVPPPVSPRHLGVPIATPYRSVLQEDVVSIRKARED